MKTRLHPAHIFGFVVSAAILTVALWVALYGPTGPLPMQYGLSGEVNRYGDRMELAVVLGGLALLNLFTGLLTRHQAEVATDPLKRKALYRGHYVTVGIMGLVAGFILWAALGQSGALSLDAMALSMGFMGVVFSAVGAVLGRIPPNPFIGVRTPWAFKSRLSWDRSNRLAGRLMFWSGLAGLIASPFAPQPFGMIALTVLVLLMAALSVYESWRVWKNDPEAQPF